MGTHGSDLRDAGAGQLARPADRAAPPVHLLSRALAGLRMEPCGPRPARAAIVRRRLDDLFSRGIDPDVDDPSRCHDDPDVPNRWPAVEQVIAYRDRVRGSLLDAVDAVPARAPTHLMARDSRVFAMVIEHELLHQETLLYLLQRLPLEEKVRPTWLPGYAMAPGRPAGKIEIPAGPATIGARFDDLPFGWDNEFPAVQAAVPAFRIDGTPVTNGQYLAFVEDGGYRRAELWGDEDWLGRGHEAMGGPGVWGLP